MKYVCKHASCMKKYKEKEIAGWELQSPLLSKEYKWKEGRDGGRSGSKPSLAITRETLTIPRQKFHASSIETNQ